MDHLNKMINDLVDSIIWSPTDEEAKALGTFSYTEINKERTKLLQELIRQRDQR